MGKVRRPRVDVDLRPYIRSNHGSRAKDMIVLHETVSYNKPGLGDIKGVAAYMNSKGYGIHGIIDKDANSGWLYDPDRVIWHVAGGNYQAIGFELVSEIPMMKGNILRFRAWWKRKRQLDKAAKWIAYLSKAEGIPIRFSNGGEPGVTSHWNVSRAAGIAGGHWDCWPKHQGGYFPMMYVIRKAQAYAKKGW